MKREKIVRNAMAVAMMFASLTSAMATDKTLKVKITGEGIEEAKMYVQPLQPGLDVQSCEMERTGNEFAAQVEASSENLYRLIYICRQMQTIVPLYAEGEQLNVSMKLDGNMPVATDNDNNKALSAMGRCVAANDRALW